jgi:hypothetical protein
VFPFVLGRGRVAREKVAGGNLAPDRPDEVAGGRKKGMGAKRGEEKSEEKNAVNGPVPRAAAADARNARHLLTSF